jgi:hypothetical protein
MRTKNKLRDHLPPRVSSRAVYRVYVIYQDLVSIRIKHVQLFQLRHNGLRPAITTSSDMNVLGMLDQPSSPVPESKLNLL